METKIKTRTRTRSRTAAPAAPATRIYVENTLARAEGELARDGIFLVTDENVVGCYSNILDLDGVPRYVMRAGEGAKALRTVEEIVSAMLAAGCGRKTRLVALGGGVVGDTAGFAAACFMRGIEWVNIPTTLLSQVDSGVGGKTGVNIGAYKNMAGAFHAPRKVIICTDFLGTLPESEWLSGIGEIIKTAILDAPMWDFVYKNRLLLKRRDLRLTERLVKMCADFKDGITRRDFREEGLRKILNLGHTIGHALETLDNYKLPHGEYVMRGIMREAEIFEPDIDPSFLAAVREVIGTVLEGRPDPYIKYDKLLIDKACRKDKKNSDGKIAFVVPLAVGVQEVRERENL